MLKKSIEDDYEQFIELTKTIRNKEARREYEWRMRILEILYPNELVTREAVTNSILLNEMAKDHKSTLNDFIVLYMKYVNKHRKEEDLPYITDKQIENIGKYYKNPEAFKEVKGIEGYDLGLPKDKLIEQDIKTFGSMREEILNKATYERGIG